MAHLATTARHARFGAAPLLVAAMLLVAAVPGAGAATVPTIGGTAATPPAFVPDWDGVEDATAVSFTLRSASRVDINIRDEHGHHVRRLTGGQVLAAGTHRVMWDGRDDEGDVLPPGRYLTRVSARLATPDPDAGTGAGAGEPGEAAAGLVVTNGSQAIIVEVRTPPVAVQRLQLTRGYIGGRTQHSRVGLGLTMSRGGTLVVVVATPEGTVVRNLWRGPAGAGRRSFAWGGANDAGARLRDGTYQMVVVARGSGMPSATLRAPLRIDRTTPVLSAVGSVRSRVLGGRVVFGVPVRASESGTIVVTYGKRRVTRTIRRGAATIAISGADLGIASRSTASTRIVRVTLADRSANVASRAVSVVVGAVQRPTSPTPPPASPPRRGLVWPMAGRFESEFGQRWGRMHEGIDISNVTGTPIVAAAAGSVTYSGWMSGYGYFVEMDHGNGLTTRYAHMARPPAVVVGERVAQRGYLGPMGSTGNVTGPHLHFETRVRGVARNPLLRLPSR